MFSTGKILIFGFFCLVFVVKLSSCVDTLELSCTSNDDCSSYEDKTSKSVCKDSRCHCFNVKSNETTKCTPKKTFVSNKLGECFTSRCNLPNSHCNLTNNKCVCDDGFISSPDEMRCILKTVHLGKPCEMNEQCVRFDSNAACNNGSCDCLSSFARHENSCRSLVNIGEPCKSHSECRKFTTDVSCVDNHCLCDENFVVAKDSHTCLPNAFHFEDCKQTSQCENGLGPGSVCDNGKCVCNHSHRNITDNGKVICQRVVLRGDDCREHSDCSYYLEEPTMKCEKYKCECREDHELYDAYQKICVKKATLSSGMRSEANIFATFLSFVITALLMF